MGHHQGLTACSVTGLFCLPPMFTESLLCGVSLLLSLSILSSSKDRGSFKNLSDSAQQHLLFCSSLCQGPARAPSRQWCQGTGTDNEWMSSKPKFWKKRGIQPGFFSLLSYGLAFNEGLLICSLGTLFIVCSVWQALFEDRGESSEDEGWGRGKGKSRSFESIDCFSAAPRDEPSESQGSLL